MSKLYVPKHSVSYADAIYTTEVHKNSALYGVVAYNISVQKHLVFYTVGKNTIKPASTMHCKLLLPTL